MVVYKDINTKKTYSISGSGAKLPNTSLKIFVKVRPPVVRERSTD